MKDVVRNAGHDYVTVTARRLGSHPNEPRVVVVRLEAHLETCLVPERHGLKVNSRIHQIDEVL